MVLQRRRARPARSDRDRGTRRRLLQLTGYCRQGMPRNGTGNARTAATARQATRSTRGTSTATTKDAAKGPKVRLGRHSRVPSGLGALGGTLAEAQKNPNSHHPCRGCHSAPRQPSLLPRPLPPWLSFRTPRREPKREPRADGGEESCLCSRTDRTRDVVPIAIVRSPRLFGVTASAGVRSTAFKRAFVLRDGPATAGGQSRSRAACSCNGAGPWHPATQNRTGTG
jgi:hypothetical protein